MPERANPAGYAGITPAYRLLDIVHSAALARAERRLCSEFTILFDANTIHHFLYDSYTEIVDLLAGLGLPAGSG